MSFDLSKLQKLRFGKHISLRKTVESSIGYHEGFKCSQLFLGRTVGYKCRQLTKEDKKKTKKKCLEKDLTFYVHCPYNLNLAKDDERIPSLLKDILIQIDELPAAAVLHVGKHLKLKRQIAIEEIADKLNQLKLEGIIKQTSFENVKYNLLLENAAGQGTEIGSTWNDLRKLQEACDKECCGFCFDTCHGFAAGMTDFENSESVVRMFDEAESIYTHGVSLFHLNDSTKEYKSRVDRHASIGHGFIWNKKNESLQTLVAIASDKQIDLVSETGDAFNDYCYIASLCS
jgi:Endonuclease IV